LEDVMQAMAQRYQPATSSSSTPPPALLSRSLQACPGPEEQESEEQEKEGEEKEGEERLKSACACDSGSLLLLLSLSQSLPAPVLREDKPLIAFSCRAAAVERESERVSE
jgi:hypothetical protein